MWTRGPNSPEARALLEAEGPFEVVLYRTRQDYEGNVVSRVIRGKATIAAAVHVAAFCCCGILGMNPKRTERWEIGAVRRWDNDRHLVVLGRLSQ